MARIGAKCAAALCALLTHTAVAQAQAPGPFIPVGSRLDGLVTWLIADGGLERVDPLTRPFRLAAVRRAVAGQDTSRIGPGGRRTLAALQTELNVVADSTAVSAELGVGAWRNGRRDSFRAGGASGAGPHAGVLVSIVRGPFVAVLNPAMDNRLKDDPEFAGKTDRFIAGRLQSGYLALTGERGDILLGRTARNWGPELFDGLQLSPSAYATDQLVGTLRIGRFELTTIAQRLDDYDTTLTASVSRWFLAHRLSVRAGKGVWLAFTETGVYGGPGRDFEPAFHMPLAPAMLAQLNERREVNLLWGVELHVPLGARTSLHGQGVIDDFQVDHQSVTDYRPWSGGFTLVVTHALASLPIHASLGYTQVRSLSYRNSNAAWYVYATQGIGLARNFADYDQALFRVDCRPAVRVLLRAEATRIRQGVGDFRQPFPSDSTLAQPGMGFLMQPSSTAWGLRASASAPLLPGVAASGEVGYLWSGSMTGSVIASFALSVRADVLRGRIAETPSAVERFLP